jgi:hypothetical protein
MSRDTSGNYSLPLANVITGTTISSTWANTTLTDLKTEMTDSMSRSGKGGMLSSAQLKADDGTVSLPGIVFGNETASGLYRAGASDVRLAINGAPNLRFTSTNILEVYRSAAWSVVPDISSGYTWAAIQTFSAACTFSQPIVGSVTGSAATVTGASQTAITSLGALTYLQVDDLQLNASDITNPTGSVTIDGVTHDAGAMTNVTTLAASGLITGSNVFDNVYGSMCSTTPTTPATGAWADVTYLNSEPGGVPVGITHSNTNGTFTALTAGKYLVSANVGCAHVTSATTYSCQMRIAVNGAVVDGSRQGVYTMDSDYAGHSMSCSVVVDISVSDVISIQLLKATGSSWTFNSQGTALTVHRIS